jgi:hypothetical protein
VLKLLQDINEDKFMKAICITVLLFSTPLFAESSSADGKVQENVNQCKSLIKSHCGSKSFKECMTIKDKKTAQVTDCVEYLTKHRKMFDINELSASFKTLVDANKNPSEDAKKCAKIAGEVCGEDVDIAACMTLKANFFPSYCRDFAEKRVGHMEAAYNNDAVLRGCTNDLMKHCKIDLGADDNSSKEVIMAGMRKYEACLQKALKKTASCGQLVNIDKKTPPSKSIQLINQ